MKTKNSQDANAKLPENQLRKRLISGYAYAGVSLLFAWLFSLTPLHQQLERWIQDRQQLFTADEYYFPNTLLLDIDGPSLAALKPHIGNWPFSRDVYGKILNYLTTNGAKAVVFDILFAEARDGDDGFQKAIQEHANAVLILRADGTLEEIETMELGMNVGMLDDIADFLGHAELHLNQRDIAVLYTEGIPEAENPQAEL